MASNAITNLINNRNTIRRLMTMDSNGEMNKIVENNKKNGKLIYNEDGVSYTQNQQQLTEDDIKNRISRDSRVFINEEVMKKSKLPKSVLESFKKEPGTPFSLDAPVQTSVLDGLDLHTLEELREETTKKTGTNEQQSTGAIDYSLLRTIINEAVQENVKKYVSAMTKKLMTESAKTGNSNSIQAIKVGDKFSFITENGDVYEATLKFKTNINTKGKKEKIIQ